MAFTYLDVFGDFIKRDLYAETEDVETTVASIYEPIKVYTAAYDSEASYINGWPFHKRTDGYITGTTIDETAAIMPDVVISCLWNKNLVLVCTTRSDINGIWTVYGLDPDDTYGYTIIAQDPVTGTVYNSVSYDKIIPAAPV